MRRNRRERKFVLCVWNEGYPASLHLRKIYERIPDPKSESHSLFRVVDEDGEGYLYPKRFFLPIELSKEAEEAFDALSELQPA